MTTVTVQEAQEQLSDLIKRVVNGEDVIIVENSTPLVRLIVVENRPVRRVAGSAKGLIHIADDFDEPLEEFTEYIATFSCYPFI